MILKDRFGRVHDYLRISLTDKCNYNCLYCNPNNLKSGDPKNELLNFEELLRVIEFFARDLEFKKFRFTGGEPLVRNGIFEFFESVRKLKLKYGFTTGLTTNASLLLGKASIIKNNMIDTLNISLDSLNAETFKNITKRDDLQIVLNAIDESISAGYNPVKVNVVIIKGINDHEIMDFVGYFKDKKVNLRFIEFMPFGSNEWEKNGFIAYKEIKSIVEKHYSLNEMPKQNHAVAKDFQLGGHTAQVSFISSISDHFCSSCNRVRISSKGNFRLCLFLEGDHGLNFRDLYRKGVSDKEILEKINEAMCEKWEQHPDASELSKMDNNNMMSIGG